MSAVLLKMALGAIEDPAMLPVLGDFIQELGWYDERVITVCVMPAAKVKFRPTPSQRRKRRAVVGRVMLEAPNTFHRMTAAPTSSLARAVAAVLIFGDWPMRPFGTLYRVWKRRHEYARELWQLEEATNGHPW